ncbi:hypothetical protein IMZ48_35685 [Candidatus Bathyarchaeota archaeon]|nr:hypothetical protein [Candidatus Bathyarchaeota archaeon]
MGRLTEAKTNMEVVYEERQISAARSTPGPSGRCTTSQKCRIATGELALAEDTLFWGGYARQGKLNEAEALSLETVDLIQKAFDMAYLDSVMGRLKLGLTTTAPALQGSCTSASSVAAAECIGRSGGLISGTREGAIV